MLNQERMLKEFFTLVKMRCSSKGEREVADYIIKKLQGLGLEVTEDDTAAKITGTAGNIIARLKGTKAGPRLMFSAHLDCVEPCSGILPQLAEGMITSAGDTILGSDDKAGVSAILEALNVIVEKKIAHSDILVVFTVGEESGLDGSRNISPDFLTADYGYVLDAGGTPGAIITMAPGENDLDVVVHGKTAHAGVAPEEGINAIVVAAKALANMKLGRIDEETTANVGIISGGHATNIIPDKVVLKCEARSRNLDKLKVQTDAMCQVFREVATQNGATVDIEIRKAYEPYVLDKESPVVVLAQKAAQALGFEVKLVAHGGGSDANFFNKYGIPAAVLGVGMSKVHTTEEYIKELDLYKTAEFVLKLAGN